MPGLQANGSSGALSCPICSARHLPSRGSLQNGIYSCTCENCGHFFKFRAVGDVKNDITITINGTAYKVGNEFNPAFSLLEFMRAKDISVGTKGSCYEGGCGVCLVAVKLLDPITSTQKTYTVNACMLQLYTCDGIEVTTIEGLGNTTTGLHQLQRRMADYDGAQCGYCTPGQIMNMYGLLQRNPKPTMKEVEDVFDSTICRCTGYRSILDAMKSFAVDAPKKLKGGLIDIEDLEGRMCSKSGQACVGHCQDRSQAGPCSNSVPKPVHIVTDRAQWFKPLSLAELYPLLKQYAASNYRLVFGNSGWGIYAELGPWNYDILIDIRGVKDLYTIDTSASDHMTVGANVTLTALTELLENAPGTGLPYKDSVVKQLKNTASTGLRNMVSWAGNLDLKRRHHDFPSDVFTMLETIGAQVTVADGNGVSTQYSLTQFLQVDMKGKVIVSLRLPRYQTNDVIVRTYRTSPRLQLCASYIVSGFNFRVNSADNFRIIGKPTIVILGISGSLVHAVQTEGYLTGKQLGDPAVLKGALSTLSAELIPDSGTTLASPTYRKSLAIGQFYKYVLEVCKTKVNPRYVSGGQPLDRPVMTSSQTYGTLDPMEYPVSKPMHKLTADYLTTGEVRFMDDLPIIPGELFVAVVLSTQGNCKIKSINPSQALATPGVVKFIEASDIPGKNNWRPEGWYGPTNPLELLASSQIGFAGQPIGLVVAESQTIAENARFGVQIEYTDLQPVVTDLREAVQKKQFFKANTYTKGDVKAALASAPHKLTGTIYCGDQFHFFLETQCSLCQPSDTGGMEVRATTQWTDAVQEAVAQILGLPGASVTVENKRLGGGFGGKIIYNNPVSGMCALAAHLTRRPMKMRLDLHTNMKMQGKRTAYFAKYEVGFDNNGRLLGNDVTMYGDTGYAFTFDAYEGTERWIDNAYYCPNWSFTFQPCKTNKPVSTPCRSPGSIPAMFVMESIMDHVAKSLNKDQLEVKKVNLFQKGQTTLRGLVLDYCIMREVVAQLEQDISLASRKAAVEVFNKANRWKKRGIHVMPNKFGIPYFRAPHRALVDVYHGDGSVLIAHGGVDMGQGINTKAIQVCAYKLGIPVQKIKVARTSSVPNANNFTTGGSITSELACKGVIKCCEQILERMAPVRARMKDPTWEQLVAKCFQERVDLTASFTTHEEDQSRYQVYSACCTEVELDVLTGQYQILQMDYLYDGGISLNPALDMGQVEGGFIMGYGYFLHEELRFDPTSGELLTDGTWHYKPPLGKDLPIKFNIKFMKDDPAPQGVLRSKAVGEPPVALGATPLFALKRAIEAARRELGINQFFPLDAPSTVEMIQMACLNDVTKYTLGN
ncbi:xanthine dehydrogenase/oxidase [Aplysia californica]|uniref:Xanthine dehydrogenase/oxidase n=1 Tax=Aplysia californica TaxID=6500 RepID=A0ABM1A0Z3_APLCA|nr:xanthine dehydrogenase/oxidase [Aplysia californica]